MFATWYPGIYKKLDFGLEATYCLAVEVEAGHNDIEGQKHSDAKQEEGEVDGFGLINRSVSI
jgi:hypothetical protein